MAVSQNRIEVVAYWGESQPSVVFSKGLNWVFAGFGPTAILGFTNGTTS